MTVPRRFVERFWDGFFWGPPSHRRIAWIGALAGVGVLALAGIIFPHESPLFTLAVLLVGLAEFGWAVELAPTRYARAAGWGRVSRWLCAVIGTIIACLSLLWGLTPVIWFGAMIAVTGALLALEMAPGGPANRA